MTFFALNLVLAVIWMFLWGDVSLVNLLVGLAVGFMVVGLHQTLLGGRTYYRGLLAVLKLSLMFAYRLWLASWQLARDILRPKPRFDPVIVAYEAHGMSPLEIAILANLISLTPGSLTIDADGDRGILYVHCLYGRDIDRVKAEVDGYANLLRGARGTTTDERKKT